ncbi:MAG: hypothetical protein NDJ89_13960 [Oligoflexia bacterium]|nr:hypothetical protein [Oligoflexia bacterium]
MFSRIRLRFLAAPIALLASSCSLMVGEETTKPSLDIGEMNCLEGGTQTLVDYFQGIGSDTRMGELWDCLGTSLALFSERTHGEERPDLYSAGELRNFMNEYFLKTSTVPEGLVAELMEFKRTILGGRADRLTREEIVRAREFLKVLKVETLRLKPYLPLSSANFSRMTPERVADAIATLESVAREIGKALRGAGQSYEFRSLGRFFEELEKSALTPRVSGPLRELREGLPLIQQLKSLLLSPDARLVRSDEWELLLSTASRWFGLYLKFSTVSHQYLSAFEPSAERAIGRAELLELGREARELLLSAVGRRRQGVIPFEEFDALIDALAPKYLKVAGRALEPQHAKDFVRVFVRRALGGATAGASGRDADGLTQAAVERGWAIFEDWSEAQRYLELLFGKLTRDSGLSDPEKRSFEREQLLSVSLRELYEVDESGLSPAVRHAIARMGEVIRTQPPLFHGESGEIFLYSPRDGEELRYSYFALSQLNFMDLLARLMMSSYAEDPSRARAKVELREVERLYLDFKSVGVDLRIFDPKNDQVAQRRFLDSNLFTFAGNGDEWMDVREATQILAYMISAKTVTARVHLGISRSCLASQGGDSETQLPETDFFGYPLVPADCYRRAYFERQGEIWSHLPHLSAYYGALKRDPRRTPEREAFERDLETVARKEGHNDSPFTSADTDTLSGLVQYLETVFLRYDNDRSGTINLHEAFKSNDAAYPVFRSALKKASGLKEDWQLETLFSYLLAHGRIPDKWEFGKWLAKGKLGLWKFEADRGRMIRILAELARALKEKSAESEAEVEWTILSVLTELFKESFEEAPAQH